MQTRTERNDALLLETWYTSKFNPTFLEFCLHFLIIWYLWFNSWVCPTQPGKAFLWQWIVCTTLRFETRKIVVATLGHQGPAMAGLPSTKVYRCKMLKLQWSVGIYLLGGYDASSVTNRTMSTWLARHGHKLVNGDFDRDWSTRLQWLN
jgi:hypothetical protein